MTEMSGFSFDLSPCLARSIVIMRNEVKIISRAKNTGDIRPWELFCRQRLGKTKREPA